LTLVLVLTTACGALSDSAPAPVAKPRCPTLDQRVTKLEGLVGAGKLKSIAYIVGEVVDEPSQRALVRLGLAIGKALPSGLAAQLPGVAADPQVARVLPLVVALLEPLPGSPYANPPLPAKISEMKALSQVAGACLTAEGMATLAAVLREPDLAPALASVLDAGPQAGTALQQALAAAGVEGRAGFQVLVRDVLVSMAAPGFDPEPMAASLAALGGQPALQGLAVILRRLASDHAGQPRPERVAALAALAACVQRQEADGPMAGHLYDVVLATPLEATPTAPAVPVSTAQLSVLLALGAVAADVVANDEGARDALSQLLGLLLRPDLAIQAVPELVGLLKSGALGDVLSLLGDLLQACGEAS
jgi:hypothetical protein